MLSQISRLLLNRESVKAFRRNYAKEIKFGIEGKSLILRGAETLANVVSITLGPNAGSVIVDNEDPKISRDGAFVANSITLDDSYENIGAQIMKKLADTTQKQASDGTKTATILARSIAKEGYNRIMKGSNPVEIRKGVLDAVKVAAEHLDGMARKVETPEALHRIATVFAGDDKELGTVVTEALTLVGKDGIITVKEREEPREHAELSRGMILESGYYMCNFPVPKGGRIKLENALLVIYNSKIESFKTIAPLLEYAVGKHKPLVILAEDFTSNVAVTFAVNHEGVIGIKVVSAKIPGDKDFDQNILKDLAHACGGKVHGDEACGKQYNKFDESYFGEVAEMNITKKEMVCLNSASNVMAEKVAELKQEISKTKDPQVEKKLTERLARLESNVAIISIDGTIKEKAEIRKEKIYAIIDSTKVAMEQGVVPGGGVALVRCVDVVNKIESQTDDHRLGVRILSQSLAEPFCTLVRNSHENPAPILHKLRSFPASVGYDVLQDQFVDCFDAGIVDTTKCVKTALMNAANTASLMVNAEAVIVFKFDGNEVVLK